MEKLLAELIATRSEMESAVFLSPPRDWAEFQNRLGRYCELESLIKTVHERMKGLETDE